MQFPNPEPAPETFDTLFTVVAVVVVLGIIVAVALAVRNAMAYRRHGLDPTTAEADLAARLMRSQALEPPPRPPDPAVAPAPRSVTERLAELDALRAAGTITPEEHRAARDRVIGDL